MENFDQRRRDLLIGSGLVASGALLAGHLEAGELKTPAANAALARARNQFANYFQSRGYGEISAKSLVTEGQGAFCQGRDSGSVYQNIKTNGNLRYDDEIEEVKQPSFVFQRAARIEDISKKGLPNVLPYFTIALAASNALSGKGEMIDILFEFLIHTAGLSVKRLSVSTTELANPYLGKLAAIGIPAGRIHMRDLAAAKAAGQGSGWLLNPVTGFSVPSLSIEYRRGREIQEIGEIGLREAHHSLASTEIGAIGLERLVWAQTGRSFDWLGRVRELLAAIRSECQASDRPLPTGYKLFEETA